MEWSGQMTAREEGGLKDLIMMEIDVESNCRGRFELEEWWSLASLKVWIMAGPAWWRGVRVFDLFGLVIPQVDPDTLPSSYQSRHPECLRLLCSLIHQVNTPEWLEICPKITSNWMRFVQCNCPHWRACVHLLSLLVTSSSLWVAACLFCPPLQLSVGTNRRNGEAAYWEEELSISNAVLASVKTQLERLVEALWASCKQYWGVMIFVASETQDFGTRISGISVTNELSNNFIYTSLSKQLSWGVTGRERFRGDSNRISQGNQRQLPSLGWKIPESVVWISSQQAFLSSHLWTNQHLLSWPVSGHFPVSSTAWDTADWEMHVFLYCLYHLLFAQLCQCWQVVDRAQLCQGLVGQYRPVVGNTQGWQRRRRRATELWKTYIWAERTQRSSEQSSSSSAFPAAELYVLLE